MSLDIGLNPPNICLIRSDSLLGITPSSDNFLFGSVYKINILTESVSVGQNVMFDKTRAAVITLASTSYFIIKEKDFEFIENPVL